MAEDVRALARSLARDFWDATRSAHGRGDPASEAFRRGIRDAADGARRELQRGMRHHWHGWGGPPPGWQPGPPPPGPIGPARPGPPAAPPWGHYGRGGHTHPRRTDPRGPLPPVRRRWDASVLAALLAVVFGTAWLISGVGIVHLSTEAVLAAGLMLLGAALIVTARTDWSLSRHLWPVAVGVVLVVGLFATSSSFGVTGALSHLTVGQNTVIAKPGQTVYGGVGQLTVKASNLPPGSTVLVQTIAGETFVSTGQNVAVNAHVLAGQICFDGKTVGSGIGATYTKVIGTKPVTIEIKQLAGQIAINTTQSHIGCGHG